MLLVVEWDKYVLYFYIKEKHDIGENGSLGDLSLPLSSYVILDKYQNLLKLVCLWGGYRKYNFYCTGQCYCRTK